MAKHGRSSHNDVSRPVVYNFPAIYYISELDVMQVKNSHVLAPSAYRAYVPLSPHIQLFLS